jgi:trimeric autotransporter adhesin
MTQAFNLAQFANKLNTSGQTDNTGLQNSSLTVNTTSPIAGGGAVALGSSLTLTHANSGVTANTYTAATITVNAQGHITAASSNTPGTVTSVATGNGLSGGTITSTGTLIIACPGFNTVGSYVFGNRNNGGGATVSGTNYAAGGAGGQIRSGVYTATNNYFTVTNNLSGTWKWMASSFPADEDVYGVCCRVS